MSAPTLMIIIEEQLTGLLGTTASENTNTVSNSLASHFRQQGFRVLDPSAAERNLIRTQGLRLMEGDDKAVAAVGLRQQAQFSLLGKAICKPVATKLYGSRMQSLQASITAKIIRNDTADTLATASAGSVKAHIDELQGGILALDDASKAIAKQLSTQFSNDNGQAEPGSDHAGAVVILNFSGLVSYRHLDYLMYFLEAEVPGISELTLNNYTEGVADIRVQYADSTRILARRIAAKAFKGFRVTPSAVSSHRIDLRVAAKQ
ncbi:MAG: hypothetical protein AB8B48_16355 [Pseudomonadales bacterium]